MKKRIVLFISTLAVVVLALGLYRLLLDVPEWEPGPESAVRQAPEEDGEDSDVPIVQTPEGVGIGRTDRLVLAQTDGVGRVKQKFGFDRRLGSEQGYVTLARPWVQVFAENRRLITIEARTGSVPVESDAGEVRFPERGQLQDTVVTMRRIPDETREVPLPGEGDEGLGPVEMTVELAGDVDFQLEFSRLESPGRVEVRSEQFEVAGRGLMLEYDQVLNRLQVLELEEITEPLRIRQVRAASGSDKASEAGDLKSPARADEVKSQGEMSTYRLSLVDDVVIRRFADETGSAGDVLYADRVDVLADFDPGRLRGDSQEGEAEGQGDEGTAEGGDLAQVAEEIIEIMCQGVLRIELARDEAAGEVERVEFTAAGAPARVFQGGQLSVEAQRIHYRMADEVMELTGGASRAARLFLDESQYVTASESIRFDPNGLAVLKGPGVVEYVSAEGEAPGRIDYAGQVAIKLVRAGLEQRSGRRMHPEWLSFAGELVAREPNTVVRAQGGRLTFFGPETAEAGGAEAVSDVQIRTIDLRDPNALVDESRFAAGRLYTEFVVGEDGQSRPVSVTAWHNVRSDTPEYTLRASEELALSFVPAAAGPVGEETLAAGSEGGLFASMQLDELSSVLARGAGGGVVLVDKGQEFRISGDRAERDPSGIWVITGEPAEIVGLAEQGSLTGSRIVADEVNEYCYVAGSGRLSTVMPGGVVGSGGAAPMEVEWSEGARYDLATEEIRLEGVEARAIESGAEVNRTSELTCPVLELTLATAAVGPEDMPGQSSFAGTRRLKTLRAVGPDVRLIHVETDPNSDAPLRRTEMVTPWLALQDGGEQLTAGPGWIQTDDFAEAAAGAGGPSAVGGLFGAEGPTRALLQYGGRMRYTRSGSLLVINGPVALDQVPLAVGEAVDAAALAGTAGVRRLDCDTLTIGLVDDASGVEEPGGAGGMADVAGAVREVTAIGGVFVEAVLEDGSEHFFAGQELRYNAADGVLTVLGTASTPAQLDQMQFSLVRWDRQAGRLEAVPLGGSIAGGF